MLQLQSISKTLNKQSIIRDISLEVSTSEIVGLLGPNGSGKTTTFHSIIGLNSPDSGNILFDSKDITNLPTHKRAALGIAFLNQEPAIFKDLTIQENLLIILEQFPLKKRERIAKVQQKLEEFNLLPLLHKKGYTLSGGEKRRLEVARCLLLNPKLILLDEPFAAIDPISINEMKKLIKSLAEKGIAVLITDHNAREVCSLVDRAYLIFDGEIMSEGPMDSLLKDEEALAHYFGHQFSL